LQCGSDIFMDADYGRNRDRDGGPFKSFEPSLFAWATVMSRPTEDRAIVDAGLEALAFDAGPPLVCDEPAATYERASDEHGRLAVAAVTNRLGLGDKIRLIPGHCDPTVNLDDWYVSVRSNRVEQLWPITARGAPEAAQLPIPPQKDVRIDQNPHAAYSKYFCISGGSGASKSSAM